MIDFIQSAAIGILGMTVIIQGLTIRVHSQGISSVRANLTTRENPRSGGISRDCQGNPDSEIDGAGGRSW